MIRSFAHAIAYLTIASALVIGLIGLAGVLSMQSAIAAERSFSLSAGDRVRIIVFGEAELSGEFELDADGIFSMPLVGPVKALELDARGLEGRIAQQLRNGFLRDPKVSVQILSYKPIYVIGEVNKPGSYPYRSGLSILNAAALAGGFTYRADEDDIEVSRGGRSEPIVMTPATIVHPGDVIRVGERYF